MLSNGQKNFIIGVTTIIVLIFVGLFVYKTLNSEKNPTVENKAIKAATSKDDKLVNNLNKDQYISKWCEFNSQDSIACLGMIQQCKSDILSNDCNSTEFKKMEASWEQNIDPDPNFGKKITINQEILKSYCEDFSSNTNDCVKDMNACFDGTSSDSNCKDYIRNFQAETDNGQSYGLPQNTPSTPSIEDIYNNKVAIQPVGVCKGNTNCNTFYALAQNWESIPESEIKQMAREGDGYGLWKGYYYTDDKIYALAEAGEKVFYNGGGASADNERIFAQGLAVLQHLQGPLNF